MIYFTPPINSFPYPHLNVNSLTNTIDNKKQVSILVPHGQGLSHPTGIFICNVSSAYILTRLTVIPTAFSFIVYVIESIH